jgi:hypothetical protein
MEYNRTERMRMTLPPTARIDGASDLPTHPSVLSICPRAGDVVVITEALTHGAKRWLPRDRDRRFMILRSQ